jgi:type VI secretion system protein VasG
VSKYRRDVLYSKLNSLAFKAMERTVIYGKLRGNPRVEVAHWLHELSDQPRSDLHFILDEFKLDVSRLSADLQRSLERLERGTGSAPQISAQLDRIVEGGYLFGTLRFQARRIRTGHMLFGAISTPELRKSLTDISLEFSRIDPEAFARDFERIVRPSAEQELESDASPTEAGTSAQSSDAIPVAQLGNHEALRRFTVDLTQSAQRGEIDPVIAREDEMRQMVDILMRRRQNNPILTGEAGVGKTAVVEGLALRIATGNVPPPLRDVRLCALDLGLLQAGASMKGEFEQRLRQVIDEVQGSPTPIILFIDEAHRLIGAGGEKGTGDAANLLKPALARGMLRTIAATTWSEYKEFIDPDPALTRRFQVVQVLEPTEVQAIQMMRGITKPLEKHHQVQILDAALEASVKLSRRYIPSRQLPDKSISLLDTACARVAVSHHAVPAAVEDCQHAIRAFETELEILQREGAIGVETQQREQKALAALELERSRLAELHERWEKERALVGQILELRHALQTTTSEGTGNAPRSTEKLAQLGKLEGELRECQGEAPLILPTVDYQAVASVVSDWTGVPLGRMVRDELGAFLRLAETLAKRVVGQDHALKMIASRMETSRAGLENPQRPIGVFMLAGPSGVGKTETALALAEALYGGEQNVITINMSEYQERHSVSLLKGAPPGYVGYGKGGVLTEAVRQRPYSVILLDEVEKAHADVHEVFFQVFDKGVMEDGTGRKIDFKNTLILLTSNVGTEEIMESCARAGRRPDSQALGKALERPLLGVFPAALLGRITTIPYYPLDDAMIDRITRLQLSRIERRLEEQHGVQLNYDDAFLSFVRRQCTDVHSGARAIDRVLSNQLLPQLSRELLMRMMNGQMVRAVDIECSEGSFTCVFRDA